jgi:predicted methyltransferase
LLLIGLLAGTGVLAATPPAIPDFITAAVANPARPKADTDRDAARKPAEVLAFSGVAQGDVVLELIPGKGYFTRLLSGAVGPGGHVYEALPQLSDAPDAKPTSNGVASDPAFTNVSEISMTPEAIGKLPPADLIWTSQNYHDLHLTKLKLDVIALDRLFFAALKPGGVFLIEDHAAKPGSGLSAPDTLHRIDEDVVKREVESVGFKLEAESDVLRNPADDHTLLVFDPAIRGHTDQFVLRFRKPK